MLQNMTRRQRVTVVSYQRYYEWRDRSGAGFSFDCDEQGVVKRDELEAPGLANLLQCETGIYDVVDRGAVRYEHSYIQPASGTCTCGAVVHLDDSLYNECTRCGRGYNGSGQELAPVSQWEPEDVYDTFGPRNRRDEDY